MLSVFKKGYDSLSEKASNVVDVASSLGGDIAETSIAYANHLKHGGENLGKLIYEESQDILEGTANFASKAASEAYQELVEVKDDVIKLGDSLADGVEEIADDAKDKFVDLAEKGYQAAKKFAEEQGKKILQEIADNAASEAGRVMGLIEEIEQKGQDAKDLAKAIKDANAKEIVYNLLKLIKNFTNARTLIDKLIARDAGSLVIYATAGGSAGVGGSVSIGIAVDIDVYIYLAKNAERLFNQLKEDINTNIFEEFNNPIFAIVAAGGVTVGASAGGGADLLIGYHLNNPDGITGPAFDLIASFKAKAGATLGVALDPVSGFPPGFAQIVLGLGAGLEAGLEVGVSYCVNIALVHSDCKIYLGNQTPNYPKASEAKKHDDPNLYWNKYTWGELGESARRLWSQLGWNENNWDGPQSSYPNSFTTSWDALSMYDRQVAEQLGYNKKAWDQDYPYGHKARGAGSIDDYWNGFDWDDLGSHNQEEWKKLGWNKDNWADGFPVPYSYAQNWDELSARQKLAATALGYTKSTWNSSPDKIVVVEAKYGKHDKYMDATQIVQKAIDDKQYAFYIGTETMKKDPNYGVVKDLIVKIKLPNLDTVNEIKGDQRTYLNLLGH